jgi:hypothetical protein
VFSMSMKIHTFQAAAAAWGGSGGYKGPVDTCDEGLVMVGEALLSAAERHANAALVNGVGKVPMRWQWLKPALLAAPRHAFTGPQSVTRVSLKIMIAAAALSSPQSIASETWADSSGKKLAPIFRAKLKTGSWVKGPFSSWSEGLQILALQAADLHPHPTPELVSAICDAVCSSSVTSRVAMLAMTSVVQRHQAHGPALCLSFAMSLAAKRPLADTQEIAACISSFLHLQSLADPLALASSSVSAAAAIASAAAEAPEAAMTLLFLLKHLYVADVEHVNALAMPMTAVLISAAARFLFRFFHSPSAGSSFSPFTFLAQLTLRGAAVVASLKSAVLLSFRCLQLPCL